MRLNRSNVAVALVVLVVTLLFPTAAASATERRPCPQGLAWCATVHPDHGPVGTLVHLRGHIDPNVGAKDLRIYIHNFRVEPGVVFLVRDFPGPPFCEFLGGVHAGRTRISDSGVIHGSFIVGGNAGCNHSSETPPALTPGTYSVNLGCQACSVDHFTVTPGSLAFTGPRRVRSLATGALIAILVGLALTSAASRPSE